MQNHHNCEGELLANLLSVSNAPVHQLVASFIQDIVTSTGAQISHDTIPPRPAAFQTLWLTAARLATLAFEAEDTPESLLDAASEAYSLLITFCRYCGASLDVNIEKPDLVCSDCQAHIPDVVRAADLQHPAVEELIRFARDSVTTPADRAWWDVLEAQRRLRELEESNQ